MIAMRVVMEHENAQGRQVDDVHEKNLGYDLTSLDLQSGELRLIEVKGLAAATGTILLTPNERRLAEDRRDCYWLYVVTNCAGIPELQDPIRDPAQFPWHEVTKVAHYYLSVDALKTAYGDSGRRSAVRRKERIMKNRYSQPTSPMLSTKPSLAMEPGLLMLPDDLPPVQ